jgi:hypothetical protein
MGLKRTPRSPSTIACATQNALNRLLPVPVKTPSIDYCLCPLPLPQVLTRTADNSEGGRQNLIKATVANSKLYLLKVQVGDKRWYRGADKDAWRAIDSFVVG